MRIAVLGGLGTHCLYVEADAFHLAVVAKVVLIEYLDLVERLTQVVHAERLVLIVFHAVLVVEMHAPELVQRDGVRHIVGGIETRENRVRAFDADANAARVNCVCAESQRVTNGAAIATVDGLVWLRLHEDQRVTIIF